MNKIGEVNKNSKGERFAIRDYRSSTDIDVVFEADDSVKNTTYAQFKSGHVSRRGTEDSNYWLGEVIEDDYGEECKIVEFNSEDNIAVQYPDGDIVADLSLKAVMVGAFDRKGENFGTKRANVGIDAERKLTFENVVYMVNRFRRCVMIRPCGFGKTKIGLKLFSSPRYQRCLFLHPASDDVNASIIQNSHCQKRIDTKTYAWLRARSEEQIKKLDYDIVFCDEVHCIGGNDDGDGAYVTYKAMKLFMETHPQTHFIGATATPLRMDGINVIATMFHNHICYPYTDEDAFDDGVLKRPNYYYCVYDVQKRLAEEIDKKINVRLNREELQIALKLSGDDIDEIDTKFMDRHIRKSCDSTLSDTSYMRFIAFYLTNDEIENNNGKVLKWFKKAYPKHQVESITVTNRTNVKLKEVDSLPTAPTEPGYEGRIDIIFNCEMLCMGYHSELITGLILDRKTQSLAKYMQMIGRLLSCDNDNPVIIFDVVDNIHSDFICKMPRQVEKEPVVPTFDKPMTFAEVVAVYPKARHWDEIRVVNRKARKSEKILIDNAVINTPDTPVQEICDTAAAPIYQTEPEYIKKEAREAILEAQEMIKEQNMTFVEAVNVLAGIQDEYGTLDPYEKEEIEDVEDFASADKEPYLGFYKPEKSALKLKVNNNIDTAADIKPEMFSNNKTDSAVESAPEQKSASAVNAEPEPQKQESDPIGFNPTYYYNSDTKELYSKNVNVLNKRSNFEEDIKAAINAVKQSTLDSIIEKWHTYPTCEENYTSFEEIDKKANKFKFLKSCSEFVFNVPVENTLVYMIEGRIVA